MQVNISNAVRFDVDAVRKLAGEWNAKIATAERQGATKRGLDMMRQDRLAAVRDAVFEQAGTIAGAARTERDRIERSYKKAPRDASAATVRASELQVIRDTAACLPGKNLAELAQKAMSEPLAVDREMLAAYGAELRRRGDKDLSKVADSIGNHLMRPQHEFDDAWQHADSVDRQMVDYYRRYGTDKDPEIMPDGSPISVSGVIASADEVQPTRIGGVIGGGGAAFDRAAAAAPAE